MKPDTPHILLINPWIHDFAAYDFWAKPFGLLSLAALLRDGGFRVSYVDCLDRFHPRAPRTDPMARCGRGPYIKTRIPKPTGLEDIPRYFSRYGIKKEWLLEDLSTVPRPDLIMVTSLMTYWYPGVFDTIQSVKAYFPNVSIILGGIYATLCFDHALRFSGADTVIAGAAGGRIFDLVRTHTGYAAQARCQLPDLDSHPYPAFDLQRKINYVPILTSRGCPFTCAYCASGFLNPEKAVRRPASVVEEIQYWHRKFNVINFVFYDDALLVNPENHIIPILEGVVRSGLKIRFHTPNALHINTLSLPLARLMFAAGFETIRLGLETTRFNKRKDMDRKVTAHEFEKGVSHLKKAGFKKHQIGAYLLVGLPGQSMPAVSASINAVKELGVTPVPAHYSPIPHTAMWPKAVAASRYDLESDPVFTNNAIFPCQKKPFSWETVSYLKNLASE